MSYAKTKKKITLKYDDRHTFNKEIRRIATENVVSTNATTGQKDRKIVSVANSNHKKIFAVGCGKAVVELKDGTTYGVLVRPAKISLLLLIGQSNMEGSHSDDKTNAEYTNNAILNVQEKFIIHMVRHVVLIIKELQIGVKHHRHFQSQMHRSLFQNLLPITVRIMSGAGQIILLLQAGQRQNQVLTVHWQTSGQIN